MTTAATRAAARLQTLLDGIRILSPTRFALGDEPVVDLAALGLLVPGGPTPEQSLSAALQGHLYNLAYVREWPDGDPPLVAGGPPPAPDPVLMRRLGALRAARRFDPGWRLAAVRPDGGAVLHKGSWTRQAEAGGWSRDARGLGDGFDVWLHVPASHPDPAGTFLFLYGDTPGEGPEQGELSRIYLHTRPECAADVLEALVGALDALCVPFTLKTLMAPASAARADATVVYLPRRYHRVVLGCVRRLGPGWLGRLGTATPLFALPLAPGVAVAEDPPGGESFGQHRLRLLAEAVIAAWRAGVSDGEGRRRAVAERFAAEGLRLDAPHLEAGSTLRYELGGAPVLPAKVSRTPAAGDRYLEIAERIGARLCREALWHGPRCTWQGWSVIERGTALPTAWRTFGPDLYRGTSGICLFLAHLYARTGAAVVGETLLGGLEQAFAALETLAPEVRIGLHTGSAGVAHAALVAGETLGRPDLVDAGLHALGSIAEAVLEPAMFDVVSGAAGVVPVLLDAADRHRRPELRELAVRLGGWLSERAVVLPSGKAWAGKPDAAALCGYSHGAAGVSLALAELYAVTGEARFAELAQAGLAYERSHYQPRVRNWTDLRLPERLREPATAMAWCHGAPGIALARLRLAELFPADEAIQAELETALATTAAGLAGLEQGRLSDYSLCHGACGNADVLLLAARALGRPQLEETARRVGDRGIRDVEERGLAWPSGNPGGVPTPGLMLGDAGIGTFYLRLSDPDGICSPLRIGPGCRKGQRS